MLKELSIRNFAIIDDLRIHLDAGLTILSGETGAGKTIIINAVNLILGGRASADMIRPLIWPRSAKDSGRCRSTTSAPRLANRSRAAS